MRAALLVTLSLTAFGCGAPQAAEPSRDPEPEVVTAPTPDPPGHSADSACTFDFAPLESYDALVEGRRFTLEVARDARGAWAPAEPLAMPLHHASAIEWRNREALDAWPNDRARVIVLSEGRTSIEHDSARGAWFATYAARVEHVCPASAAEE